LCGCLPVLNGTVTMKLFLMSLVVQAQEALAGAEDQSAELTAAREALVEKETTVDRLRDQVESLLQEVTSVNEAYARLQVTSLVVSRTVDSF